MTLSNAKQTRTEVTKSLQRHRGPTNRSIRNKINANSKTNKIKAFYLVLQQNVNHRSQSFTDIPMSRPIGRKSKQSCKAKSAKSRVTQSKVKRKKRSS